MSNAVPPKSFLFDLKSYEFSIPDPRDLVRLVCSLREAAVADMPLDSLAPI